MTISRIAVGDGEAPEGTNPAALTGLIREAERSRATCSAPVVADDVLSFEIEYRNKWDDGTFGEGYTDPDGLTEGFWLKEYGVFALDGAGNEIMLYYAGLGEFPEPVARWNGRNLVSKRYPVSISIVDDGADAQLAFPAGAFVTSEYLEERLAAAAAVTGGSGVEYSRAETPKAGTRTHYRVTQAAPDYRPAEPTEPDDPPETASAILLVDERQESGLAEPEGGGLEDMKLQLS
jgi:hypothetical protein